MVDLLFDWFGISCVTTDNFCFYLQTRLIQTSQTGGQWFSDTSLQYSLPQLLDHYENNCRGKILQLIFLQHHEQRKKNVFLTFATIVNIVNIFLCHRCYRKISQIVCPRKFFSGQSKFFNYEQELKVLNVFMYFYMSQKKLVVTNTLAFCQSFKSKEKRVFNIDHK